MKESSPSTEKQPLDRSEFRRQIKALRESSPEWWEASRKLMTPESWAASLPILLQSIQDAGLNPLDDKRLIDAVQQFGQQIKTKDGNQTLKELTGFPPSKALRALLVWGVLAHTEKPKAGVEDLSVEVIEGFLKESPNPYDLLLRTPSPSLLDIGAGDLTFEEELVNQYVPQLRTRNTRLRVHAFDRLMPGSRVGGVYHKIRIVSGI